MVVEPLRTKHLFINLKEMGKKRRKQRPKSQDVAGSGTPSFSHGWEKTIDEEVAVSNRPDSINSSESSCSGPGHSSVPRNDGAIDNVVPALQSSQGMGNGSSQKAQPVQHRPPQPMAMFPSQPPALPLSAHHPPLNMPPPPPLFWQNQTAAHPPPIFRFPDPPVPPAANAYGFSETDNWHSMPQPPQSQFISRTESMHTRPEEEQQNQMPRHLEDKKNTLAGTLGNSVNVHFQTSDTNQRPPENGFSHPAQQVTPPGFHPGLSEVHHSVPRVQPHLTSPQTGAQGTFNPLQLPPPTVPHWHTGPAVSQSCNPNNPQQSFTYFAGFPAMYPSFGPQQFMYGMQYPHPMYMLPAVGQQHLMKEADCSGDEVDTFLRNVRKLRPSHARSKRSRSLGRLSREEKKLQRTVMNDAEDTSDTSTGSENEEVAPPQTIKIRGIQDKSMATKCKYYFRNPNKGGGNIQDEKWDNIDHIYYIQFEDSKVAKRVVSTVHKLGGRQLEISFAPAGIPESVGLRTVEISGIDVKLLEVYQLYFENPSNGGGPISKMWEDKQIQKLFITFEDAAVAEEICSRKHDVEDSVLEAELATMEHLTGGTSDVSEMDKASTSVEAAVEQPLKDEKFYHQYFETCQGGGQVKELILNEKDGKVLVTFDSIKVAQQVACGRHLIDGKEVALRGVSFYPDKLLLRNVAQDVTKELLMNYMENVSGQDGLELLYSDEPGDVVVCFDKTIEFSTIKDKCSAKTLNRRKVQVYRVAVSNCILVENLAPMLSDDEVAVYFESDRADGGTVLTVHPAEEQSKYIFFEEPEVVQRVVMKKHRLGGRELRVKLYLECLGPSGGMEDPYVFVPPKPLELSARDNIKIQYLRNSSAMLQMFNEHLSKVHAGCRVMEDRLKVETTLTAATPKVHLLVSSWRDEASKQLETCFGFVSVDRQDVLPDIWPEVKKAVEECETGKDDFVLMFEDEKSFVVLGRNGTDGDTWSKIQTIIWNAEKEFSLKKQEVTETQKLKEHEFDLFKMSSLRLEAKEQYSRLKVDVRDKEREIIFHGQLLEIKDIQAKMLSMFLSAPSMVVKDMTHSKITLLASQRTQNMIGEKLKEAGLAATWDCRSEGVVTVYCVEQSDLRPAVQVIEASLREEDIPLDEAAARIIAKPDWENLKAKLSQDNNGCLLISTTANKIQITAVSDVLLSVKEAIDDFIVDNTIYRADFCLSPSRQTFLSVFWEDMLTHIAEKLSQYKVHIAMDERKMSIQVTGTSQGIERARGELEALDQKIVCRKEEVTRKETIRYLVKMKSICELEKIGKASQCVISQSPEENGVQILFTNQPAKRPKKTGNPPTVSAMKADITQLRVDAVVNAANDRMQHGGGLAGAILSKGGREIQEECYRLLRTRGSLSEGDVLVSGPGKLPCKAIIHAVGPRYKGGNKGEERCLRDTVMNCLQTASERHYTSVALPAISSGIFGYPVDEATSVIVEAVRFFFDANTESSIRDVTLCDISQNTVDLFHTALVRSSFGKESEAINRDDYVPELGDLTVHRDPFNNLPEALQKIHISVTEGEIAKVTSDAIVNSTSTDLNLKAGAISSSILKAAGTVLQEECSNKYPKGIPPHEIACTGGYNLGCKAIFHVALCKWQTKGAVEQLTLAVKKCLKEASNRQFSSVAIPPLGTGVLGFPREVAAHTILSTIDQFQKTSPNTSLKEIKIVVFNDDKTLEAFGAMKRSKTQIAFEESLPLTGATALPEDPASNLKEMTQEVDSVVDEDLPSAPKESMMALVIPSETVISWPKLNADSVTLDLGGLHLTIKQGDITDETADAIVNSTNSQMDLSKGAVSKALKAKCGEDLQRECNSKRAEIVQQTTAMTEGYNLKSKHILHLNAAHYHSSHDWQKAYTVVLQAAEKNDLHSLAMPALGTGHYSLSPSDSAGALAKALAIHKQTMNSLTSVIVVLADSDTAKTFIGVFKGEANSDIAKKNMSKMSEIPHESVPKKSLFRRWKERIGSVFKSPKDHIPDVFKLYVFSASEAKRQEFCEELYKFVDGKYESKEIRDVENLSPEELEEIKERCVSLNVELKQKANGYVVLKGMPDDVEQMRETIRNVVRETEQQHQAIVMANVVQWYYFEGKDERKAFGKKDNLQIEEGYQTFQTNEEQDSVETEDDNGNVFVINFAAMKKYPKGEASDGTKIMRKEMIKDGVDTLSLLPETWELHEKEEPVRLVDLQSGCDEYNSVQSNFSKSACGTFDILSIQRIQNPDLYKQYIAKKAQMVKQNKGMDSEKTLWHGTSSDVIQKINLNGFNRSFCGKNDILFGEGTYFAVKSAYSMHSTYSSADLLGKKYIYQCKVLVGHSIKGNRTMKRLPVRQGDVSYDSATDNLKKPDMYVIFHDAQAYPEYLITFVKT